jgi:two-component system, OmpR family, response regulator
MRILLVEDDDDIRHSLRLALQAEHYAVDTAADGERGIYLGRTNEYDLIILDNMLPKKTGIEVCQALRGCGHDMPILILSVRSEILQKIDLLDAGADDYLCKPFSFNELTARARALTRRHPELEEACLRVDDMIIDKNRQVVTRGGTDIYLTRKEFALLEYLARHPGHVMSRSTIMEHVWDINCDPFSNTIEAHVRNIRKKIELPGSRKLLHTVPGRGYKLDVLQ